MSKYTASICKKISIVQVIGCQDNLCELQVTEISFACITGSSALCASCPPMRLTSAGRHEGNTADTGGKISLDKFLAVIIGTTYFSKIAIMQWNSSHSRHYLLLNLNVAIITSTRKKLQLSLVHFIISAPSTCVNWRCFYLFPISRM